MIYNLRGRSQQMKRLSSRGAVTGEGHKVQGYSILAWGFPGSFQGLLGRGGWGGEASGALRRQLLLQSSCQRAYGAIWPHPGRRWLLEER